MLFYKLPILFLLCSVLYAVSYGSPVSHQSSDKNPTIVGGYQPSALYSPYLVYLNIFTQSGDVFVCTGSIISANRVLCAAHCFVYPSNPLTQVQLWVGVPNINDQTSANRFFASAVDIPQNYNPNTLNNDVAVVTLATNTASSQKFMTLADSDPEDDSPTFVSGWGRLREGGFTSNTLQQVALRFRSFSLCESVETTLRPILNSDIMLCASAPVFSEGGKDTCQGDSGGPLFRLEGSRFRTPVQYGITSFGIGCARAGRGGWYAKVKAFKTAIDAHVAADVDSYDTTYWLRLLRV